MKNGILTLLMVLGFTLVASVAFAGPKIIVANFFADWCAVCKAMAPSFVDVKKMYEEENILFVQFDKTNRTTSHQARLLAQSLGIEKAYSDHSNTGFILLIDANSKEVVGELSLGQTVTDMADTLDDVLAGKNVMPAIVKKGSAKEDVKGSQMKGSY